MMTLLAFALFLGTTVGAPSAQLKDVEHHLKSSYKGKILTLRSFYSGDELLYNSEGKLLTHDEIGSWTLYSQVEVTDIKLRRDKLEIMANRVFVRFGKDMKDLRRLRSKEKVRIELRTEQSEVTEEAMRRAMVKAFLSESDRLADIVPSYWNRYVSGERSPPSPEDLKGEANEQVYRVKQGEISAPRCVACPDPKYIQAARQAKLEGTVVLAALLNKEGRIQSIHIVKPIGLGLDDAAVETVRQWQLEPARRSGEPVFAIITVEVTFRLLR